MRILGVATAMAILLPALLPLAAEATQTTLTFDDIPNGTTVSTQYGARGATFGPSVAGQAQATRARPVITSVGTTQAASGSQVGRVQRFCFSPECVGTAETWTQFSSGQARVRVSVGGFGTVSNTLTLTGFNSSGAQVAQASVLVTGGQGFRTPLTISATTASIRFIRIRGSSLATFGIDNLFFTNEVSTGPDFAISVAFGPHTVQQGRTLTIPVTLTRRNSSGTIRLSASGLPSGASIPSVDHILTTASSLASSHTINLQLSASANAPPATDTTVTITGKPLSTTAGLGDRSLTVRVRVLVLYDLRVTAVEPTQGIQSPRFAVTTTGTLDSYVGVPLQSLGRTIVRVYANTPRGGFQVPFVGARLHGFDSGGRALPGSPLFADGGTRTIPAAGNSTPTFAERSSPTAAFTFTLPLSWTGLSGVTPQPFFSTQLRAELLPPTGSISFRECDGCSANDTRSLTEVGYTPTCCVTVASAIITANGGSLPRDVRTIMRPGLNLFPLQIDLKPYGTTLDLTGHTATSGDRTVINRDEAVRRLLEFNQRDGGGEAVLGVLSPEFPDRFGGVPFGIFDDVADRPFTSSAHQLGHALGRPHASASCGAEGNGPSEPWPPDETGLIQGFALDRTAPSPYRLFATPEALDVPPATLPAPSGDPRAFYDFMSYCAIAGGNDPNAWISVKGWTDLITRWRNGVDNSARIQPAQNLPQGRLQVNASMDEAGGVRILSVLPLTPKPQSGLQETSFRLVTRDAAGAALAEAPVSSRTLVSDRGGRPPVVLEAAADVDPAAVQSVEITRDGVVLARRDRSPNAPTARFTSPRRGELVGRGDKLTIRWRAADADGDQLEATVEWSARGGRPGTWRTVFLGGNGGRVGLPSEYFGGSDEAFLRLRVSDGFNETVVVSPGFRTIHRRPTILIQSPRRGTRVRRDRPLALVAEARDETGAVVPATRLRWFLGRRLIARGSGVPVRGLPAGVHTVRVAVADSNRRRGSARVRVRVLPTAPALRVVDAPRRVSRRARVVRLRVSSSLRARLLVVGGARRVRALVGARSRTVRVPVVPGSEPLRLRLNAHADGRSRVTVVEVDRR